MRNFYEHQNRALAKSAKLYLLLAVAILGTVIVTSLAVTYTVCLLAYCMQVWNPGFPTIPWIFVFLPCCFVTGVFVGVSSWWKIRQLKAGGKILAIDLGGELLERKTASREELRALNVVEEMAIAAGIPVPAVYVLRQQSSINAFAAGLEVEDAVIGLTRGCVVHLNREQLQGVVAHEFSHVFNGDMRINLRIVGILHGVLSITMLAERLLMAAYEIWTMPSTRRDNGEDVGAAVILALLGVLLWPIGLVGMAFGLLVMSATSRQREFLADAYAVQFTRNPEGIAGALKVIAGLESGSRVRSSKTLEASHFFFASGCRMMAGLLATHPPLEERIRRLEPSWDGVPLFVDVGADAVYQGAYGHSLSLLTGGAASDQRTLAAPVLPSSTESQHTFDSEEHNDPADSTRESIFQTSDWTQRYQMQLQDELPGVWHELLQEPEGVDAVLTALWFVQTDTPLESHASLPDPLANIVEGLMEPLTQFEEAHRTLLFDMASQNVAERRRMETSGMRPFLTSALRHAPEDTLKRWTWNHQFRRALQIDPPDNPRAAYAKVAQVEGAAEIVLSRLCHAGSSNAAMAQFAFQRAVVHLELPQPDFWEPDEIDLERLEVAVDELRKAAPPIRQRLMLAIGCCIAADQGVTTEEAELVRGLCAALGWAMPRLLPGQSVAPGA